jgi:hypothetical protein
MAMADDNDHAPKGIGLSYIFYQHVAGVLGAFALAAMLQHLLHLSLRGIVREITAFYAQNIRPVTQWILDETVVSALRLVFHDLTLPAFLVDYFSVGIVLGLSLGRALIWNISALNKTDPARHSGFKGTSVQKISVLEWLPIFLRAPLPIALFLWPLTVSALVIELFHHNSLVRDWILGLPSGKLVTRTRDGADFRTVTTFRQVAEAKVALALALSPLIYFVVLLAMSYLLLKPGT